MFSQWAERLSDWRARLNGWVLPPVLEPGAMPWSSLFYLIFPFVLPLALPKFPQPDWPLTIAGGMLFLPLYFLFYWVRGWRREGVLFAMSGIAIALLPANFFANTFLVYSNVLAAFLPLRRMFIVIASTQLFAAIAINWTEMASARDIFLITNLSTSLIAAICSRVWLSYSAKNQALRLSQDEIRRLAQVAERERIGRDLHDLLGHTLSVVAIKSELAAKLFARDPAAAQREIADVERIAREALGQVRRAVTGMRAMGLRAEFASARLALASASVDFEYQGDDLNLHAEDETVLALSLREATTNVIRHSGALRCRARLAREGELVLLNIVDDGHGGVREDGNGLKGMRERAEALGGRLLIRSAAGEGTELTVILPYREPPKETAPPRDQRPRLAVVR